MTVSFLPQVRRHYIGSDRHPDFPVFSFQALGGCGKRSIFTVGSFLYSSAPSCLPSRAAVSRRPVDELRRSPWRDRPWRGRTLYESSLSSRSLVWAVSGLAFERQGGWERARGGRGFGISPPADQRTTRAQGVPAFLSARRDRGPPELSDHALNPGLLRNTPLEKVFALGSCAALRS